MVDVVGLNSVGADPAVVMVPNKAGGMSRAVATVNVDASGAIAATGGGGSGSGSTATWATPTVAQTLGSYSDVEVQFVGTPSTPYAPVRSLDGTNFVPCNAYDKDGNVLALISAAGIYSFDGGGYFKFSAGGGSTLTIRVS